MSEREKFAVRLEPELRERLDRCFTVDGSRSRREYIVNAIQFYTDYLEMRGGSSLLPKEVTSAINGRLGLFEDRLSSLLFKLTVALDMNAGSSRTPMSSARRAFASAGLRVSKM